MEKIKMMLVDDEERFLYSTQKLLKKKGYDLQIASNGMEALEKLKTANIQVVILDVKLPGMDGIAILKEIKKNYPVIEVIMLTGHATVETAVEGLKIGAADYLIKPIDIHELVDKAHKAFIKKGRKYV